MCENVFFAKNALFARFIRNSIKENCEDGESRARGKKNSRPAKTQVVCTKAEKNRCDKCGSIEVTSETLGMLVAKRLVSNGPIKLHGEAIVEIDSYSETDELDLIRNWDGGWEHLFDYIKDRWRYADCGYWEEPEPRVYKISTGGWNWNEEVIDAMKQHRIFWLICWYSSKRGGHYEFRIPALEGQTLKHNKFYVIGKRQNIADNS